MRQDFLEIFSTLLEGEVQEYTIYKLVENVHSLIKSGHKDSIPNALRKVHECMLYRCNSISPSDYPLVYYFDNEKSNINISATTRSHFRNITNEFKHKTLRPFLTFVNTGSHSEDVSYASIKEDEIKDNILRLIQIINWYLSKVKGLKNFQLETKFSLPKVVKIEDLELKNENLKKQLEEVRNELRLLKKTEKELRESITTDNFQEEETLDKIEEGIVNLDILEKDVFDAIDFFNKEKIYCTHRTVVFFLFGLRITQTDFKDLSKAENFGKYQDNKFTEYEYDTVLNNLLGKERVFLNGHFLTTRDYSKISNEDLAKELGVEKIVDREEDLIPVDENIIQILQSAIEQNKNVRFVYLKSIPNLNKASVKARLCKPLLLKTKSNDNEFYYLRAKALNEDIEKSFRLDSIQELKIID